MRRGIIIAIMAAMLTLVGFSPSYAAPCYNSDTGEGNIKDPVCGYDAYTKTSSDTITGSSGSNSVTSGSPSNDTFNVSSGASGSSKAGCSGATCDVSSGNSYSYSASKTAYKVDKFLNKNGLGFLSGLFGGGKTANQSGSYGGGAIADVLCSVVSWFTGSIGQAIATLAIIVLGVGAMFAKVSHGSAVVTAVGIATIFSAPTIVSNLTGTLSVCY